MQLPSRPTPELSAEQFRALGYRAVDMVADHLGRLGARLDPARRPVPAETRDLLLSQPLPREGSDPEELLRFLESRVVPYPLGNGHPRFFGWVNSPAAPLAVLGSLIAAGMNPSVAGGDQSAVFLERAVLDWMKEILGFPRDSGALLVSGGSMATVVGLAVMRSSRSRTRDVRGRGLAAEPSPMVVYTSTEGHGCIQKAVELLGLGHDFLRRVEVDGDFRMDVAALERQIREDRAQGLHPAAVVATAGIVNTGAIDPLDRIADLCAKEGLWLHVDGAYGGIAVLSSEGRRLLAGIERADSLGIDPHKWMYVPVECGCVLVRDGLAMRDSFSLVPPYLRDDSQLPWFSEFGPQQTRGFRALPLWLALRQVGVSGYRRLIDRDIGLARALREKIGARADFRLVAAGPLSITCFQFAPSGVEDVEALNRRVLARIQEEGDVFLTGTELAGRFALRACIVNFRTEESDLDRLLEAIADAGRREVALGRGRVEAPP
ncbi:MAG TPA: aminotransferase class I/II-fold pyridoxal phosphate-dependent enzyme [Planctomycetota bacterium]|nr:aminotransferase class I/II-fold pyridoxal phosphate-dependent enzyme [Planctomycetota bacterium]